MPSRYLYGKPLTEEEMTALIDASKHGKVVYKLVGSPDA